MIKIPFKKLSELAIVPTKKRGDAGYDLYSTEDYVLKPMERKLFHSQIAVAIPEGHYGRIADRSGNAYKKGLHVMGGVIDSNYRGSIGAILINLNPEADWKTKDGSNLSLLTLTSNEKETWANLYNPSYVEIKKGDRIAQIIFEKYEDAEFEEFDILLETERGDTGFGASGQ